MNTVIHTYRALTHCATVHTAIDGVLRYVLNARHICQRATAPRWTAAMQSSPTIFLPPPHIPNHRYRQHQQLNASHPVDDVIIVASRSTDRVTPSLCRILTICQNAPAGRVPPPPSPPAQTALPVSVTPLHMSGSAFYRKLSLQHADHDPPSTNSLLPAPTENS